MNKLKKIAIHGVPRSGTTWLGAIFDSHPNLIYKLQPLFSYRFKDRLTPNSSKDEINIFFKELAYVSDDFLDQNEGKANGIIPNFIKDDKKITHLCYKEVRYHHILENMLINNLELKIVGLIRNPFSVINSWLKAPKEFKKELGWKIEDEWRDAPKKNLNKPEEFNGYNKWKEVAFLFLKLKQEYPQRFYLLAYEDLLADRVNEIQKLFDFAALEYTAQTAEFLNDSGQKNDQDAYSVFKVKDKDNSWENELPSYIIEEIKNDEDFKLLNETFKWI